ncbi:MAG: hypothetical protein OXC14_08235 [Rhodospirillaceae bacterium]|nr:hypothetical protein [Rhodospirillaceae bacterium]
MNDETATSCEITSCGVSVSADRSNVAIYLGGAETDKSFKFTMPKDLAIYMSNTIQRLANGPTAPRGAKTPLKAR